MHREYKYETVQDLWLNEQSQKFDIPLPCNPEIIKDLPNFDFDPDFDFLAFLNSI